MPINKKVRMTKGIILVVPPDCFSKFLLTFRLCFLPAALALLVGCASLPYNPGLTYDDPRLPTITPEGPAIVRGPSNWFFDNADWFWPQSWISKLIFLDTRVDNHTISPETEEIIRQYLITNELHHVKVRLNAYHVGDEWRRLFTNRSVGAGWRYTFGIVACVQYTVYPGIIMGGDNYNPYTNTINLYSDVPAIAIHEGGHAKDFANRRFKGAYAALYMIPFVNLYHEARATSDALGYLRENEALALQREGYQMLYPAYGTYVGSNFAELSDRRYWQIYLGSIVAGHVMGRTRAAFLRNGGNTDIETVESAAP